MTNAPVVSVVLSFRNEAEVIPELIERLQKVLRSLPIGYEIIFVNDASTDKSLEILTQKRAADPNIKVLNMSRRFGVSECALAGMEHAKGDAVIIMDADLQDPPELIPELFAKWREGADVVYTVRSKREGESAGKMFLTRLAYRAIRSISEIDLPENAGDYKLISRRVLTELLKLKNEKQPYLRGLVTWMGFKQVPVYYERQARGAGETHFPIFRSRGPIQTFVSGVTAFSTFPLHFFLLLGLFVSLLSVAALAAWIIEQFTSLGLPAWWPIVVVFLILSGIQLIGIGVLGLYLARVYHEVRSRPNYIVESTVGIDSRQG